MSAYFPCPPTFDPSTSTSMAIPENIQICTVVHHGVCILLEVQRRKIDVRWTAVECAEPVSHRARESTCPQSEIPERCCGDWSVRHQLQKNFQNSDGLVGFAIRNGSFKYFRRILLINKTFSFDGVERHVHIAIHFSGQHGGGVVDI